MKDSKKSCLKPKVFCAAFLTEGGAKDFYFLIVFPVLNKKLLPNPLQYGIIPLYVNMKEEM